MEAILEMRRTWLAEASGDRRDKVNVAPHRGQSPESKAQTVSLKAH